MSETPIESLWLWNVHHAVKDEMRKRGACKPCSEQVAFAATDVSEGKTARELELCERCKRLQLGRTDA